MSVAVRLARYRSAYSEACEAGLDFFSDSERQRHATFAASARREQFTAARWLMRCLLVDLHGGVPAQWQLSAEASTAPRVIAPSALPLHIGLSHSGDWVACAVANAPVGIDLETTTRARKVGPLARQACTPDEQRLLLEMKSHEQLDAFYRMWTLKEAWLKQRGLGLDFSLMRGLVASATVVGSPAQALSLGDPHEGLRLAVTMDVVPESFRLESGGLAFAAAERWELRQVAA